MKQKENTVGFYFVITDAVYIFRACVVIFGKGKNPQWDKSYLYHNKCEQR